MGGRQNTLGPARAAPSGADREKERGGSVLVLHAVYRRRSQPPVLAISKVEPYPPKCAGFVVAVVILLLCMGPGEKGISLCPWVDPVTWN